MNIFVFTHIGRKLRHGLVQLPAPCLHGVLFISLPACRNSNSLAGGNWRTMSHQVLIFVSVFFMVKHGSKNSLFVFNGSCVCCMGNLFSTFCASFFIYTKCGMLVWGGQGWLVGWFIYVFFSDNGYIDNCSQIQVHTDERMQVHSAHYPSKY